MGNNQKLLINLVGVPSRSGEETEAVKYLCETLPSMGWEKAFADEAGNLVASRGNGDKELLFLCHIDTVPGGPPFHLDGKVLWGRGAVDAKGPLCALAAAGAVVPVPDDWRITLVAAVREETDSGGAKFRLPLHTPAACIVGEPSGAEGVTLGYRGSLRIMINGEDGGAHRSGDSGPLTGCLRAASRIMETVELMDIPEKPVIERTSAAVAFMEGIESVGRKCKIDLDIRLPVGEEPEKWIEIASKSASQWGVNAEVLSAVKAHVVPVKDPVIRAFRVGMRRKGIKPRLLAKSGTADFNLAADWGCPMAAYGPGDSLLDHTDSERIDLDEYALSISVLEEVLPLIMKDL
jgi:LysW-gamma-L-lysine carboxypeptidase